MVPACPSAGEIAVRRHKPGAEGQGGRCLRKWGAESALFWADGTLPAVTPRLAELQPSTHCAVNPQQHSWDVASALCLPVSVLLAWAHRPGHLLPLCLQLLLCPLPSPAAFHPLTLTDPAQAQRKQKQISVSSQGCLEVCSWRPPQPRLLLHSPLGH